MFPMIYCMFVATTGRSYGIVVPKDPKVCTITYFIKKSIPMHKYKVKTTYVYDF